MQHQERLGSTGNGSASRHPHQSHSGRSSHHTKEHGRKHHRESGREKEVLEPLSPYFMPPSEDVQPSGGHGGGFEMGVISSGRRSEEESAQWFQSPDQTTPLSAHAPPTYMSGLPATSECDVPCMGAIEDEKKMEQRVSLWQEGWKPGPLSCTIPKLYEPIPATRPADDAERVSSALDFPRDREGNNLVLHCMGLQSYIQEIKEMLARLPEDSIIMDSSGMDCLPKKPTRFHNPDTKLPVGDPLRHPATVPRLSLNKQSLGKLQRKSAAAICSFSGYECASPEALEVLSDLLGSFLSNFTKFLKINADHSSGGREGCRGFHDTLERSLHQVGMEGKNGLRQYWKTSVLACIRQLEMEAEEYKNAYLRLTVPEEKLQMGSSSGDPSVSLSSPFSNSKLFSSPPQENLSGEEEMSLEVIMQQSRATIASQRLITSDVLPAGTPLLPDTEMPPEPEGFVPLEIDGPLRKR